MWEIGCPNSETNVEDWVDSLVKIMVDIPQCFKKIIIYLYYFHLCVYVWGWPEAMDFKIKFYDGNNKYTD